MKKYLATLLLLLPLVTFAARKDDVEQVRDSLQQFVTSWNKGDIDGALDIYKNSTDARLISDSVINGYTEIVKFWKASYPNSNEMGKMTFSHIDVKLLSTNYAMAVGKWTLTGVKNDTGGIFTVLFEKTDHGWKSVIDHTTGL